MARRTVLSFSQRVFFGTLLVDPVYLVRYYRLSAGDWILIRQRRWATNPMGFAVLLCLAGLPGRIRRLGEQLQRPLFELIAEHTRSRWQDFEDYVSPNV